MVPMICVLAERQTDRHARRNNPLLLSLSVILVKGGTIFLAFSSLFEDVGNEFRNFATFLDKTRGDFGVRRPRLKVRERAFSVAAPRTVWNQQGTKVCRKL